MQVQRVKLLGADGDGGVDLELGYVGERNACKVNIAVDHQAVSTSAAVYAFTSDHFTYAAAIEVSQCHDARQVYTCARRVADVRLGILAYSGLAYDHDDVVARACVDRIRTFAGANDVIACAGGDGVCTSQASDDEVIKPTSVTKGVIARCAYQHGGFSYIGYGNSEALGFGQAACVGGGDGDVDCCGRLMIQADFSFEFELASNHFKAGIVNSIGVGVASIGVGDGQVADDCTGGVFCHGGG